MDPIGQNAFKQKLVGSNSSGATSIELDSISNTNGDADYLPDPTNGEYNVIFYNTLYGNPADARNNSGYMIGRVTAINYSTNTLTITTAQENTPDVAMDSDWAVLYGATAKWFTELISEVDSKAPDSDLTAHENDTDDPHATKNTEPTQQGSSFTASEGEVYESTHSSSSITITIPTGVKKPIYIRQGGAGTNDLSAAVGVTLRNNVSSVNQGDWLGIFPTGTADTYDVMLRSDGN